VEGAGAAHSSSKSPYGSWRSASAAAGRMACTMPSSERQPGVDASTPCAPRYSPTGGGSGSCVLRPSACACAIACLTAASTASFREFPRTTSSGVWSCDSESGTTTDRT
jgi:hypothetical protein